MQMRLLLGIAAAVAVLVVAFWGAGSEVRAVEGGSISGTVYFDTDLDGRRDPDEKPAPGRTIELTSADGQLIDSDLSDRDGTYVVEGVLPDVQYWVNIRVDADTPCRSMDGFDYPPYDGILNADFGVLEKGTGSISGTVVDDRDEDGVRDVGEPGSEGWGMYLVLRSYNGPMYCDFYDVSDYSGRYGFTGLPLLTYEVEYWPEYNMPPWEITSPVEREDRASATHYPLVDLRDKSRVSDVDIEVHFLGGAAVIKGLAFRDLNLNTVRDEGEPVLACGVYADMILPYRQTYMGKLLISYASLICEGNEFTLSGVAVGTYNIELYSWCIGPDAPPNVGGETSSRWVTVADGQHPQPVEMNMCPQAAAWYPIPEPTPSATATPILILPDVGTGTADRGNPSSKAVMPATTLIAVVAIIGTVFVLRRRARRA